MKLKQLITALQEELASRGDIEAYLKNEEFDYIESLELYNLAVYPVEGKMALVFEQ